MRGSDRGRTVVDECIAPALLSAALPLPRLISAARNTWSSGAAVCGFGSLLHKT